MGDIMHWDLGAIFWNEILSFIFSSVNKHKMIELTACEPSDYKLSI